LESLKKTGDVEILDPGLKAAITALASATNAPAGTP
jgi:hypothetical protein